MAKVRPAWVPGAVDWLPGYRRNWWRPDILAGLTAAAVVIPKAMAYATIAGLPLQVGLYTCFIPMLIYAFFGSSRVMSVSTTTTIAILAGAQLGVMVPDGNPDALITASVTLALMVGIILSVAAILRLGFVANFISEPVLIGFKAGIGIVVIVDQIPKLLGLHFDKGGFVHNLGQILSGLGHLSWATLAVGIGTIGGLVLCERWRPRWPAPLIVVGLMIAGATFLGWEQLGVELVGAIPTGLPSLTLPDFSLVEAMWPAAAGIALMSFAETAAVGRAFIAEKDPPLRPNTELFATGLANIGGSLLGSMPGGGGTSQTAVNRNAGAKTQMSGVVAALAALLTMFLLAPFFAKMPNATLAGVVIVYSVGLIHFADFKAILKVRRTEFIWALAAIAGVILLGTLKGILVAIIISVFALGFQAANPVVNVIARIRGTNGFRPLSPVHPDDEIYPGLMMVRPEGRLFFLNAEIVSEKIRNLWETQPNINTIILDLRGVFDLEYSALKMIVDAERRQRAAGVKLIIAAPNDEVRGMLMRSPLGKVLSAEGIYDSLDVAVEHYLSKNHKADN
ncbi:MAG: SulP family inorganic anion transporter [Arenimonas sp.]|nr:SulP family inorganic anion transporter [Arenimonas sp.]